MLGPYKDIELSNDMGCHLNSNVTHSQRECLKNFLTEAKHSSVSENKYKTINDGMYAVTACDHVMMIHVRKDQEGNQFWQCSNLEACTNDSCSS